MARYFFDIHDGDAFCRDLDGTECADPAQIRHEAMRPLPEIANHAIPYRATDAQTFPVVVRDADHRTVYTATLSFAGLWTNAPMAAE